MLKISYSEGMTEAGCDEAGRGCLAGPVFAACVILPPGYEHPLINDSKMLSVSVRDSLRRVIEEESVAWSVGVADSREIDELNILNASFLAMHRAIKGLPIKPDLLLVDGNRFLPFPEIPHICIVKGDSKFQSVAAASILAKTHRDEYMVDLHSEFPAYNWLKNKGYPTREHLAAIRETGLSPLHRRSFRQGEQLKIFFRTL